MVDWWLVYIFQYYCVKTRIIRISVHCYINKKCLHIYTKYKHTCIKTIVHRCKIKKELCSAGSLRIWSKTAFHSKPTIINFFVTHCTKWTYHKPFISVVNSKTVHSKRETFCMMFSDWPKRVYEDWGNSDDFVDVQTVDLLLIIKMS